MLNRIHYQPSQLEVIYKDKGITFVDIISKSRGLEIINSIDNNTSTVNGVLGFYKDTKALILNCEYADGEFLDESSLKVLFIGKNFKGFISNPLHLDRIKYLYVHNDNPYFISNKNKLMEKEKENNHL